MSAVSPDTERRPAARPSWAGPRAAGVALLALGVLALLGTFAVPAGRDGWAPAGPRFFPLVASIGLIVCALAFLLRATLRPDEELREHVAAEAAETEWRVPALVAVALVGYVVLIEPLGYVLSTALFFPLVARALGSRAWLRDVLSGVGLAVGVDFVFTQLLGVPLPPGVAGF